MKILLAVSGSPCSEQTSHGHSLKRMLSRKGAMNVKLEVFDPPMCCSTGVCGVDINPVLPRFATDLEWLKSKGVDVERYNLAQEPGVFVARESVRAALRETGNDCLPLLLVNGQIVSRAVYPDRLALADFVGVSAVAESNERVTTGRTLTVLPNASQCC